MPPTLITEPCHYCQKLIEADPRCTNCDGFGRVLVRVLPTARVRQTMSKPVRNPYPAILTRAIHASR